jgi:ABC-2 type transport system permease protein
MLIIAKNEFLKLFKSIKSILTVLVFTLTSYYTAGYFSNNAFNSVAGKGSPYYSSLRLLIFIFGYLFVTILSHDCINREIELQTIRLITSKVSRLSFILGKFFGIACFWLVCLSISTLSIILVCNKFELSTIFMLFLTCIYYISITILISCIIKKSSMTNFIGLLISFAIPIFGLYCSLSQKKSLSIFSYLFPYYYVLQGDVKIVIILIISIICIMASYLIINRKDF